MNFFSYENAFYFQQALSLQLSLNHPVLIFKLRFCPYLFMSIRICIIYSYISLVLITLYLDLPSQLRLSQTFKQLGISLQHTNLFFRLRQNFSKSTYLPSRSSLPSNVFCVTDKILCLFLHVNMNTFNCLLILFTLVLGSISSSKSFLNGKKIQTPQNLILFQGLHVCLIYPTSPAERTVQSGKVHVIPLGPIGTHSLL